MPPGTLTVEYNGQKQSVRLQLWGDSLTVQKEELAYTYSPTNHVDAAILARVSHYSPTNHVDAAILARVSH